MGDKNINHKKLNFNTSSSHNERNNHEFRFSVGWSVYFL